MKSVLSSRSSPASSNERITVSKQELEQLVEREVQQAIKQKESSLDALIESLQQQLRQGMDYGASIRILQSQMIAVAERAEQALAQIEQNPTAPHGSTSRVQSHLETESTETVSKHTDNVDVSSVSEFMEKTKKEFERLHAENAALKAAFEDIRERTTPSPTTNIRRPNGVFEGLAKLLHIKKEPADDPEDLYSPVAASLSMKRSQDDLSSPEVNSNTKRTKSERVEVPYPPLPDLPFPSSLPLESVNYNIPSRLKVDLALIKNPSPQLSVVFSLDEIDPNAPPMASYSIYNSVERATGSGLFDEWQKVGEVSAGPLPLFYTNIKYQPGYKICVSVVGKDKFERYGPFSKVTCASL